MTEARCDAHGLTIGEAARRAGVPASTLRYWESRGLLRASHRVGGQRRYDRRTVRLLSLVVLMKRGGFKLAEIRTVLTALDNGRPPAEIWRELAEYKLPEIEQTLVQANAMKKSLEVGLGHGCETVEGFLARVEAVISSVDGPRGAVDRKRHRRREHQE